MTKCALAANSAKYRIKQLGTNAFVIQQRFLGLWWDTSDYYQWSKEKCLEIIAAWEADRAVRGRIVWP